MACRSPPKRESYCGKAKKSGHHRRPRHRSQKRKSCRPGKVTRNPFFNYLRWFRKQHCDYGAVKVAVEGAKCWCKMSDEQRKKFYMEACRAPKMRSRKKTKGRGRGRSSCGGGGGGRRKRSRSKKKRRRSRSRSSKRRGRSHTPRSPCG